MAKQMHFLVSLLFIIALPLLARGDYNVVDLGAISDGVTDSSESFLSAWARACASADQPATVYVPRGSYLLSQTIFSGPCKNHNICIRLEGTLVAPLDYARLSSSAHWLLFQNVGGVSIYGGTLDGRGSGLWACKASKRKCPFGERWPNIDQQPTVPHCNRWMHEWDDPRGERDGPCISIGHAPNTDGIHVEQSTGVTINGTNIKTGDDCISIGQGSSNLWIEHIACGPGHGISIGSLGKKLIEAGIRNVTVKSVEFTETENGFRIKSWARPSNGFVKGVLFEHAVMHNVHNPIIVDQNYCPHNRHCPGQVSGVQVSDVNYRDIKGSSATDIAVKFNCSEARPCIGIELHDVKLTYENGDAEASCHNAEGTTSGFVFPTSCWRD
ncbi:hypothetical protein ACLOJK_008882 [Asimina triloba]